MERHTATFIFYNSQGEQVDAGFHFDNSKEKDLSTLIEICLKHGCNFKLIFDV